MKKKRNTKRKQCCYCHKLFHKRGLYKHEQFCLKNPEVAAFAELLRPGLQEVVHGTAVEPVHHAQPFIYAEICCVQCGQAFEILVDTTPNSTAVIKIAARRKGFRTENNSL